MVSAKACKTGRGIFQRLASRSAPITGVCVCVCVWNMGTITNKNLRAKPWPSSLQSAEWQRSYCLEYIRHSSTYAVLTFRNVQHKSNYAPVATDYTHSQIYMCIYKGVQLKCKLHHTGTWLAATWPNGHLRPCPAVSLRFLRLPALSLPHETKSTHLWKMLLQSALVRWCVWVGSACTGKERDILTLNQWYSTFFSSNFMECLPCIFIRLRIITSNKCTSIRLLDIQTLLHVSALLGHLQGVIHYRTWSNDKTICSQSRLVS